MTDRNKDKHLDELLDSMLSAYSRAEPRPGLENRILAGVRQAAGRPVSQVWNWKWLWAGMAVAAALLLFTVWAGRHLSRQVPAKTVVHVPHTAQPEPQAPPDASHAPDAATAAVRRRPAPRVEPRNAALALDRRPAVFPTPTPLSEQEQLMLSYLARTPRQELIAQSHPDEPPAIAQDESGLAVPDLVSVPQKSSNTQ